MELDQGERVELAVVRERAVLEIGDDAAAGVALEAGPAPSSAEGLGPVAIGVEHVGIRGGR